MHSHMGKKLQDITLIYYSKCLGGHFSLTNKSFFAEHGKTMLKVGFFKVSYVNIWVNRNNKNMKALLLGRRLITSKISLFILMETSERAESYPALPCINGTNSHVLGLSSVQWGALQGFPDCWCPTHALEQKVTAERSQVSVMLHWRL